MRMVVLLLVVLICFALYMRANQPVVWNSWMAAWGTNSFAVTGAPSDADVSAALVAPTAHAPLPAVPVAVGGLIRDGNFSTGGYWVGDGQFDPSGKGLVVTLNPSSWTRVYQTFSGDPGTQYSIEITYRLSPGITLSQDPGDYTEITKRVQIAGFENFTSMGISPGNFYGTIGDPNSQGMAMEVFTPQIGTTEVQVYRHTYPPIPAGGNKTFALAFPPGTGTVTLLTAYVTSR